MRLRVARVSVRVEGDASHRHAATEDLAPPDPLRSAQDQLRAWVGVGLGVRVRARARVRIPVRVRVGVGVRVRVRVGVCVPSMVSMVLRPRKTAKASAKVRKLKYARLSSPVSGVGSG